MRIGLATDISSRDGSVSKDAKTLNCFMEGDVVIKRPASSLFVTTPTGRGQGGFVGKEFNQFATLNPLDKSANISMVDDGNLTITNTVGLGCIKANIGKSTGKWYFEITRVSGTNNTGTNKIGDVGFCALSSSTTGYVYENANAYSLLYFDWSTYNDLWAGENGSLINLGYTGQIDPTETFGVYIDFDSSYPNIIIGCTNSLGDIGFETISTLSGTLYPAISIKSGDVVSVNFGQTAFANTVPAGFNEGWYEPLSENNDLRTYILTGDVLRSYNAYGKLLDTITL